MWETTRVDGKRKLKHDAIPTLFNFSPPPVHRKKIKDRSAIIPVIPACNRRIVRPLQFSVRTEVQEASTSSMTIDGNQSSDTDCTESSLDEAEEKERAKLQEKLKNYNKQYTVLLAKCRIYKKKLRSHRIKFKKLENEIQSLKRADEHHIGTKLLKSILNPDQIEALKRKSTRGMKWSNSTLKKALKLKFSCGNSGYEEILKQNTPLPAVRTLQRRLENLKFDSGVLNEVFEFLHIKVGLFKSEHEKDCAIILDEMTITPSKVYDISTSSYIGNVTLPNHSGVATHALVIMLGGISTRWKQTVAYYFSGDSVNGTVYDKILTEVITKSEDLGLKIVSITSDMGSSNQALWKYWKITAGRHSKISNFITHPLHASQKIFILADAPHLFKNIKNMFITNKIIEIPKHIQDKFNLPTNLIKAEHVYDLINYQKDLEIKLAPKLSEEDMSPNHYQKMRVSKSTHVISHEVSSALKFISGELNKPEFLTTAWFIETIAKWFSLVTSRHPSMALSKLKPQVYSETIIFLKDVMEIIQAMDIGTTKFWKPSQTGLLITTQSLLDIQQLFLEDKGYIFLLTSRFTQDCLENLFSVVRAKQLIPTAIQFKNSLKLICVSQYLKDVSKGSYDQDDREFLSDFLDVVDNKPRKKEYSLVTIPADIVSKDITLNNSESNSLYNLSGYIITSIRRCSKTCNSCIESVGSKNFNSEEYSRLVSLKCFQRNCLFYCNYNTFICFIEMEKIFREFKFTLEQKNVNLKDFFLEKFNQINTDHILQCHNLHKKIKVRFLIFRLKIAGKKKIGNISNLYGSKSMRK